MRVNRVKASKRLAPADRLFLGAILKLLNEKSDIVRDAIESGKIIHAALALSIERVPGGFSASSCVIDLPAKRSDSMADAEKERIHRLILARRLGYIRLIDRIHFYLPSLSACAAMSF
jgi:hypothetical protein